VSYALLVFVVRRLGPRIGEARVISYQGLVAGLLLAPFAVPELGAIDAGMVGYLSIGALVPGAVGGLLFVRGLERVGSSRAAVLAFAEPVCAVAIGWMFWNEGLGPLAAVGAACIVVAGVWVSRSPATYSTDSV
jgi:probable blue pigment (indigoidine) exporter